MKEVDALFSHKENTISFILAYIKKLIIELK